jgi:hypothetical protein
MLLLVKESLRALASTKKQKYPQVKEVFLSCPASMFEGRSERGRIGLDKRVG